VGVRSSLWAKERFFQLSTVLRYADFLSPPISSQPFFTTFDTATSMVPGRDVRFHPPPSRSVPQLRDPQGLFSSSRRTQCAGLTSLAQTARQTPIYPPPPILPVCCLTPLFPRCYFFCKVTKWLRTFFLSGSCPPFPNCCSGQRIAPKSGVAYPGARRWQDKFPLHPFFPPLNDRSQRVVLLLSLFSLSLFALAARQVIS